MTCVTWIFSPIKHLKNQFDPITSLHTDVSEQIMQLQFVIVLANIFHKLISCTPSLILYLNYHFICPDEPKSFIQCWPWCPWDQCLWSQAGKWPSHFLIISIYLPSPQCDQWSVLESQFWNHTKDAQHNRLWVVSSGIKISRKWRAMFSLSMALPLFPFPASHFYYLWVIVTHFCVCESSANLFLIKETHLISPDHSKNINSTQS